MCDMHNFVFIAPWERFMPAQTAEPNQTDKLTNRPGLASVAVLICAHPVCCSIHAVVSIRMLTRNSRVTFLVGTVLGL